MTNKIYDNSSFITGGILGLLIGMIAVPVAVNFFNDPPGKCDVVDNANADLAALKKKREQIAARILEETGSVSSYFSGSVSEDFERLEILLNRIAEQECL